MHDLLVSYSVKSSNTFHYVIPGHGIQSTSMQFLRSISAKDGYEPRQKHHSNVEFHVNLLLIRIGLVFQSSEKSGQNCSMCNVSLSFVDKSDDCLVNLYKQSSPVTVLVWLQTK